jgi:hypothetical protein
LVDSANLSGADLTFANFTGAWITGSKFAKATFTAADLRDMVVAKSSFAGAQLNAVNLSGTRVIDCDFSDADLSVSRLEHTLFEPINLKGADLRIANLSGAMIVGDLDSANLTHARMDAGTVFGGYGEQGAVRLNAQTRLLDVSWNGAILALVNWDQVPHLGDEIDIKDASTHKERVQAHRDAARAYYGLAKALEAQGLTTPALRFRRRQHQLERAAQLRSFNLLGWLFSSALNIVSGYGDRPLRA